MTRDDPLTHPSATMAFTFGVFSQTALKFGTNIRFSLSLIP